MAFIVNEADESSWLNGSAVLPSEGGGNMTKTFLSAMDVPPAHFAHPQYPAMETAGVRRNLLDAIEESDQSSLVLPPPPTKETLKVYLRVKPKTLEETELIRSDHSQAGCDLSWDDGGEMVKIESDYQVALNAPKESNTFKNSVNGAGQLMHRYSFTKIFSPETDQAGLFQEMVLPRVRDFLEGSNQLVFTYGATSSGKTYTIQGSSQDPGILPRALDVIFNSVGEDENNLPDLKPNCFNRVVQMKDRDLRRSEEDKMAVFGLGRDLQLQGRLVSASQSSSKMSGISQLSEDSLNADLTNVSSQSLASMFPFLANRHRDESKVELKQSDIKYAMWISFAEIYNENVHDLLEKIPATRNKGEKPRRPPLKLAEDKNGSIYVRGLKEIKVNSANEAYQIMMIGRENLHFAATRLNHHSSRSHCIFSIKAIRVVDVDKPHLARVSMLTFCDLAGSERIKKTMNTGDRQKEAGNINTSLLVLGRCIKAIRHNQHHPKKAQIVPFRESKLTRMFQSFLVGHGKASMVVNISQAPYLFDESMQVLKFSAIASKVTVETLKEPETVKLNNKRKKTRFSIMVESNKSGLNSLMGRGSIAWEKPAARSTMCPITPIADGTMMDESSILEETVVDERYEGLLKLIDSLKDQLIKAKQDNVTLEQEIRTELCTEFNKMMVDIEESWEKRLQHQKDRDEELSEWRLNKLQAVYKSRRKRQREHSPAPNETMMFVREEMEINLEDKNTQIKFLEDKVDAITKAQSSLLGENKKLQEEVTKGSFQRSHGQQKISILEGQVEDLKKELKSAVETKMASIELKSAAPVVADLERQLKESEDKRATLEDEKTGLKELLDEAGQDFLEKTEEVRKIAQTLKESEQQLVQQAITLNELNGQLEESRLLLTDSATRMEEKEKTIADLEELLEKKSKKEKQNGQQGQESEERLAEVNKLKQELVDKVGEITTLKSQHKVEMEALESEVEILKQDSDTKGQTIAKLEGSIDSKGEDLEKLKNLVEQNESKATNNIEKNLRKAESDKERVERELNDEIEDLKQAKKKLKQSVDDQAKDAEAKEKEVTKLEREVKSLLQTNELAMEKRECHKLREVMSRSTPNKASISARETEVTMLREELMKKTEVIKNLEVMIPTRKELTYSSDEEDFKKELGNLQKEMMVLKASHEKEMLRIKKASDMALEEYRHTNSELLRQMGRPPPTASSSASSSFVGTDPSAIEGDDSQNDNSLIEETPNNSRKRRRGGQTARERSRRAAANRTGDKTDSATQASFEDSTLENDPDFDEERPKRSTRLTRAKPVRKAARRDHSALDESGSETRPGTSASSVLKDLNNLDVNNSSVEHHTPSNNSSRKRTLYKSSKVAQVFTPPAEEPMSTLTPKTIVKRQLRSRSSRKK
eukprot:maker-scaffold421_size176100-snap-gene-0.31 protein:Tk10559 transcript:maker-scaffold421_size176100-snap-gene-0.31-mRNA-1 annotation:"golgin subfamily a member 4-like"